jgi:hypothetical protein
MKMRAATDICFDLEMQRDGGHEVHHASLQRHGTPCALPVAQIWATRAAAAANPDKNRRSEHRLRVAAAACRTKRRDWPHRAHCTSRANRRCDRWVRYRGTAARDGEAPALESPLHDLRTRMRSGGKSMRAKKNFALESCTNCASRMSLPSKRRFYQTIQLSSCLPSPAFHSIGAAPLRDSAAHKMVFSTPLRAQFPYQVLVVVASCSL